MYHRLCNLPSSFVPLLRQLPFRPYHSSKDYSSLLFSRLYHFSISCRSSSRYFSVGHTSTNNKNDDRDNSTNVCDADIDYFKLLNIPNSRFLLNETSLEDSYKTLQRRWHPDLHSTSTVSKQTRAANMSSLINHAYQTLRKPHLRAKYMLKQRGLNIDNEDGNGKLSINQDESFLMRMVEMREKIAESDHATLHQMNEENRKELDDCYTQLDKAFSANDLDTAKTLVAKLQYLRRIAHHVHERLPTHPSPT